MRPRFAGYIENTLASQSPTVVMELEEPQQRILIVDDEPSIRDVLAVYLRDEGFLVDEAADGRAALRSAASAPPDLLLLDLNLPTVSGIEVFRRLRATSDVPVIMLTARTDEVDRVVGLELGADDYIGKPFSPREVVARVKSVLRRTRSRPYEAASSAHAVRAGPPRDIDIDRTAHEVRVRGKTVDLTPMEFRILDTLEREPGRAFTREQLLERIATDAVVVFDRTLDRHVANLRQKVEREPSRPRHILTVFGVGYKYVI
jgi:DNA-binding response OmpR family regulator